MKHQFAVMMILLGTTLSAGAAVLNAADPAWAGASMVSCFLGLWLAKDQL